MSICNQIFNIVSATQDKGDAVGSSQQRRRDKRPKLLTVECGNNFMAKHASLPCKLSCALKYIYTCFIQDSERMCSVSFSNMCIIGRHVVPCSCMHNRRNLIWLWPHFIARSVVLFYCLQRKQASDRYERKYLHLT